MDIEQFWGLIDASRLSSQGDPHRQSNFLIEKLSEYPTEEIIEFDQIIDELLDRAYLADLWDAAYVIEGGCSYDGFFEFRSWLIQQGKAVYEGALLDPESLADVVGDDLDALEGGVWAAAYAAYRRKTGQEMPERTRRAMPDLDKPLRAEEDKFLRFPRLNTTFGT